MFLTNNQSLNYADWAPVASFFTGWIHIGLGCQQLQNAKQNALKINCGQNLAAASDLKKRRFAHMVTEGAEAWKHIHRGILVILLPIISNIFFMIYDLVHANKKPLPPTPPPPVLQTPVVTEEAKKERIRPVKEEPKTETLPPKAPRVIATIELEKTASNEEQQFLLNYKKCHFTLDFYKFFEKIKNKREELKLLATTESLEITIQYYCDPLINAFDINENEYHGSDWLISFIPHLNQENLKTFLDSLFARKDLGTCFYMRLLTAACQMSAGPNKIFTLETFAEHIAKNHESFVESLDPKDLDHQKFAEYLLQKMAKEKLHHLNFRLCEELIDTFGSVEEKKWLAQHKASSTPTLLDSTDPAIGALACKNDPIAMKAFFNCLAGPTIDSKVLPKLKLLIDKLSDEELAQNIKANNFHFHPNDKADKYLSLLECCDSYSRYSFVYYVASRKNIDAKAIEKLLYAISKSKSAKSKLYISVFKGLKDGGNLGVLGHLSCGSIAIEAYTALLLACSKNDFAYQNFIPFYQPNICKFAFNEATKQSPDSVTLLALIQDLTFPANLSDDELKAALNAAHNSPKKLHELFKAGHINYKTKLCSLMSAETVAICMHPKNDVFELYKELKGEATALGPDFIGKQSLGFLNHFFDQLSRTPKNLKRFFKNPSGESFYLASMNKITEPSKQVEIKKIVKKYFREKHLQITPTIIAHFNQDPQKFFKEGNFEQYSMIGPTITETDIIYYAAEKQNWINVHESDVIADPKDDILFHLGSHLCKESLIALLEALTDRDDLDKNFSARLFDVLGALNNHDAYAYLVEKCLLSAKCLNWLSYLNPDKESHQKFAEFFMVFFEDTKLDMAKLLYSKNSKMSEFVCIQKLNDTELFQLIKKPE